MDKLLGVRQRFRPDSQEYVRTRFCSKGPLQLIGRPLIKRLSELGTPEQSRAWWYPTSVLGYLPLHAMGPIPSAGNGMQYSQTCSLRSLHPEILARDISICLTYFLSLPDASLLEVSGEIQVIQSLKPPVKSLISQNATPSSGITNSFHFACHGVLTIV